MNAMNDDHDPKQPLDKAIHSEDEPMGKRSPSTPFAMVGLTYLIILGVVVLAIGAWLVWLR